MSLAPFCAVFLLPRPAAALRQDHYDLASLILASHAVVLAERGLQRPLKNWAAATPYTVKKVHRGTLLPGQKIELFEHDRPDPGMGLPLDSFGEKKLEVDSEEILVIGKWDPLTSGMQSWLPKDTPSLRPMAERFLSHGRVYMLDESFTVSGASDPGPSLDSWYGEAPTLAEFEDSLRNAITKVESFLRASSLKDPGARRKALLELIPEQGDPLGFEQVPLSHDGYADRLRRNAIVIFTEAGDIDSALEVAARSSVGLGFHFQCPIPGADLLAAARRQDLAPRLRAAALYLLARRLPMSRENILDQVQDLLECKDFEVKRAAAHILAQAIGIHAMNPRYYKAEDSAPILKAILGRWRAELDPAYRLFVLRACGRERIAALLSSEDRKPDLLLAGAVRAHRAHFMLGSVSEPRTELTNLKVVATRLGTHDQYRSRPADLEEFKQARVFYFGDGGSGGSFPIQFEPALPAGRYRMWIEGRVEISENAKSTSAFICSPPEEIEVGK